uniref:Uncharacterized protein n=1 Tax=Magallana gigas TaxID=29159 RepID=A0A8W8MSA4_MAGGI
MTRPKVRADHMIKNPRRIRAIRPSLKMEMVKAASLVIIFLVSITECANCPPCPFRHGVYKCTKPKFATCVTLHGQPVLREITVFDCRVTIKKMEWKNNHGVIIRDRFQQICTETTERTKRIETTTTTPVTTRPEKHETIERTTQIETTTTTPVSTRPEKHETTERTKQIETTTTTPVTTRPEKHGTTIKDLKEKFLKAMNSAEETESLTDIALGFLMWAIMASVAAFLVLLKKWFLKKCCGEERSTNNQPTQQPTLNPAFSRTAERDTTDGEAHTTIFHHQWFTV